MSGVLDYAFVKIVDEPNYRCTASCFEQNLIFEFTWVGRLRKRFVTVKNSSGVVFLQNTALTVDEVVSFNTNAVKDGYACSIVLLFNYDGDTTEDYLNWSRNMFLSVFRIKQE